MLKVGIIGLGYVGTSLARALSRVDGVRLVGMDYTGQKVFAAQRNPELNIEASNDESVLSECDVYLVCVPTPASTHGPNDHYVISAAKQIERQAKPGALAIVESTVPIGFMEKEFYPIMDRAGIYCAYSPERVNPLDTSYTINNINKLLCGRNKESEKLAYDFYSRFINKIVVSDNVKEVEAAKLLENAYRLVNIDFINQFQEACDAAGLNANNIVNLAGTKNFGFEKFYPGPGAGGHCIPVDPTFLSHYFKKFDANIPALDAAILSNEDRPRRMLAKIEGKYGSLNDKKVLVVGISYKKDIGDSRNSAGNTIFKTLLSRGVDVHWHDDHVGYLEGRRTSSLSQPCDLAIIVVDHSYISYDMINAKQIIDISGGEF